MLLHQNHAFLNFGRGVVQGQGGAIYNDGTLSLRNVTLDENSAGVAGGAIYNVGTADLTNVTLASSFARDGQTFAGPGQLRIGNSIMYQPAGNNCSGPVQSLGHNIESGDTCGLNGTDDRGNTDPYLGPLADNGGPTDTHHLLSGSPAIDAGSPAACPTSDQRGVPRPRDGDNDGRAICDIGAFEAPPFGGAFVVNSTADDPDAHIGDGVCAAAAGTCTLRAAVEEANAADLRRSIILAAGVYRRTGGGILTLKGGITITGGGPSATIVDAAGSGRVFLIDRTGDVAISGITIRGGREETSGDSTFTIGGGIWNRGSLTLKDAVVTDNQAIAHSPTPNYGAYGGGIASEGRLRLERVTLSGNVAQAVDVSSGGALITSGPATLTNVTITQNSADSGGFSIGAVTGDDGLELANVTIAGNIGQVQLYTPGARMRNTIVYRPGGNNCKTPPVSLGNNLENGDTCSLGGPNDQSNTDPRLGPLADNGGLSPTHALLPDSPAVDRGADAGCPSADQRGAPRPRDGNGDGSSICDIGAFEAPAPGDQPPVVCAPRPPITVHTEPTGDGRLRATISVSGTNNTLGTLRFTGTANAEVEVAGQTGRTGAFSVDLPPGTTRTDVLVRRAAAGQAATVRVVVVDRCGEWSTFFGGGPNAF